MNKYDNMNYKNKDTYKIAPDHLLTLCEIWYVYTSFSDELENLIKSKTNKNIIYKLYNMINGKFTLGSFKYKEFIKKYKDIIEIMQKNKCLKEMTIDKYDAFGDIKYSSTDDYFYKYLLENKDNIEIIKNNVIKMKKLGITEIIYNKNNDFKGQTYQLNTLYPTEFNYLENIEVIPSYKTNPILYKTENSCYRITLFAATDGKELYISIYGRVIEVNNLIFSSTRLPDEITKNTTYDIIEKQAINRKREYEHIKDFIDVVNAIDDLNYQFKNSKKVLENISSITNKEELQQILTLISNDIEKLDKTISINDYSSNNDNKVKVKKYNSDN